MTETIFPRKELCCSLVRLNVPVTIKWSRVTVSLTAFLARLAFLCSRPLWYDEAFSKLYASLSPARMIYGTVASVEGAGAAEVHPLSYYFLLHGWMRLVGNSVFAIRFLSVILGMITVCVLWRLASWCFGARTGMVVGWLAATNPFHVAYSQEARMYALLGLSAVTAAWGLLRALGDPDRSHGNPWSLAPWNSSRRGVVSSLSHWALFILGSAVTLYAHNLGVFVLLALHLMVIVSGRWRQGLRQVALADLVVLALFGPWLATVLPGQIGFVQRGYWVSPPGAPEFVRALMLPVLTFYEPAPPWLVGLGLLTSLLIATLILLAAWRSSSRVAGFLALAWAPIALLLLASLWRPVYIERALLPSALFYLVAVAWFLTRPAVPQSVRIGVVLLLAVSIVGSLSVHYRYDEFPRPPFRAAVEYLDAHIDARDAVVHTNKLTYLPMHAYDPDLPGTFMSDPAGSPQDTLAYPTQQALSIHATSTITEAVGDANRTWLVYFPREVQETRAIAGEHAPLQWIESHFNEVSKKSFSDMVVALYQREG